MNPVELIRKKRNGLPLAGDEIKYLIESYTKKRIPDYQFSAFLMTVFFQGMSKVETSALTDAMLNSGKTADLKAIPGLKIDKHSTGGVGDKTSLIIAPIVAAAGINVPMISGRGLGHTGGTLDKLESIPGFRTDLNLGEYKKALKKCGAVLIGQTENIAPADKLIYALRDVTATVESIPLITASIMSKKLAEGIDGLVLDVKTGSGAFMKEYDDSKKLANSLIETAKAFNKKVKAFITDMNQPLGMYVGNWLEVYESIKVLQGERVSDLCELSFALSGAMIELGGKAKDLNEGIEISKELVNSGKAFDKFIEIAQTQGGDIKYLKNPEKYPKAKITEKLYSNKEGYISSFDNYEVGMASLELGAGRKKKEAKVNFKAGIVFYKKIGDFVVKNDLIAELKTDKKEKIQIAKHKLTKAVNITETKPELFNIIKETLN